METTLTGSEKQIKWATQIRADFLAECERQISIITNAENLEDDDAETIARMNAKRAVRMEKINIAIEVAGKITKAAYWIDFRSSDWADLELMWRYHRDIVESRGM